MLASPGGGRAPVPPGQAHVEACLRRGGPLDGSEPTPPGEKPALGHRSATGGLCGGPGLPHPAGGDPFELEQTGAGGILLLSWLIRG